MGKFTFMKNMKPTNKKKKKSPVKTAALKEPMNYEITLDQDTFDLIFAAVAMYLLEDCFVNSIPSQDIAARQFLERLGDFKLRLPDNVTCDFFGSEENKILWNKIKPKNQQKKKKK